MLQGQVSGSVSSPVVFDESRTAERIRREVGALIIESIREVLGNEHELGYDISSAYAIRKSNDPRLKRIPGKSANQPMVLSAEMYEALEVLEDGDGFIVQVREGAGMSPDGFDYTDYFDQEFKGTGLQFMQKGLDRVEHLIPDIVARIVLEEMGL